MDIIGQNSILRIIKNSATGEKNEQSAARKPYYDID